MDLSVGRFCRIKRLRRACPLPQVVRGIHERAMWHEAAGRSDASGGFAEVVDRLVKHLVKHGVFVGHCLTVHSPLHLVPDHTIPLRRLYAAFLAPAVQDRYYASYRESPTPRQ